MFAEDGGPEPRPDPFEFRPWPWAGPPSNVLGRPVDLQAVLYRSATMAVVADAFRAYPTGVQFRVGVVVHHRAFAGRPPSALPDPFDGGLRIAVAFADGRRALLHGGGRTTAGPVLAMTGGSGGGLASELRMWLHPLPPPGPLTLAVKWDEGGVPETAVEVDAGPVVTAAAQAEELWPDDRPELPGPARRRAGP